ncbi:restriction endonuclease subunit S [Laribacter hongkongensis]|uniref:restriction endonuclease subunit S n=1 Tax=Laribacter hongkongensis TaxID=168471 RepID=UPI001EFEE955|nr:restriction endonuclease subunit S [Laribacter hongkongensis]MCG9059741.1 restriction endonuclease subunit S [Laribacter hongkongensis]MCG9086915.1 restriction endonuclease subunit S [Laribacter hongkongensis]
MRPGYKKTEAGVIPEDWDAVPLTSLGCFKNGINKGSDAFGHGSPFLNLMDVFGINRIWSNDAFGLVKTSEAEQKTYDLRRGDVVFVRSSVKPSGVGLTAVIEVTLPKTVYSGFLIRFRDNGTLDIGFKRHCFYAENFRNRLIGASSVSANTNINQDNLKKLIVPLPPTVAEQRAIATALSDADALLDGLTRLIAKKRDLKQATMQQLLTGQTRLPGFSGEWEVKRIGEFTDCSAGGTPSTKIAEYWNGAIPWMNSGELNLKQVYAVEGRITEAGLANSSTKMIPAKCVLIGLAGQGKTRGTVAMNHLELCTNQSIAAIFPNESFIPEYLYYNLDNRYDELRELSTGDGGRGGLNLRIIKSISLPFPPVTEQSAIATVLSDMDAELAALDARLTKTRALKQAMMSELLTGKTRLPT